MATNCRKRECTSRGPSKLLPVSDTQFWCAILLPCMGCCGSKFYMATLPKLLIHVTVVLEWFACMQRRPNSVWKPSWHSKSLSKVAESSESAKTWTETLNRLSSFVYLSWILQYFKPVRISPWSFNQNILSREALQSLVRNFDLAPRCGLTATIRGRPQAQAAGCLCFINNPIISTVLVLALPEHCLSAFFWCSNVSPEANSK